MKVDRLGDKLKTQLLRYENVDKCHVQRCRVLSYKQMKTIPLSFNFPTSKGECLFSFL